MPPPSTCGDGTTRFVRSRRRESINERISTYEREQFFTRVRCGVADPAESACGFDARRSSRSPRSSRPGRTATRFVPCGVGRTTRAEPHMGIGTNAPPPGGGATSASRSSDSSDESVHSLIVLLYSKTCCYRIKSSSILLINPPAPSPFCYIKNSRQSPEPRRAPLLLVRSLQVVYMGISVFLSILPVIVFIDSSVPLLRTAVQVCLPLGLEVVDGLEVGLQELLQVGVHLEPAVLRQSMVVMVCP